MEPSPVPPGIPAAHPALAEQTSEDAPQSSDSSHYEAIRGRRNSQWERPMDLASLGTTQPQPWYQQLTTVRRGVIRQILGLNPLKTSYFALYRPLEDLESRAVLAAGLILSIAAGVPLPLIGVILGRIINNFPPPEDELNIRLVQLMGVAVVYFAVTWGWSVCWALVGERLSRKTRENLLERALGMDMAFFDVEAPNMTNILTEKTQTIQLGTSEKAGIFIASISYFLSAFTVGFVLNPRLTGVLFATVVPAMAAIVYFGTKAVTIFSKQATMFTDKAAALAESAIRAVQVVQAFGISEQLAQEHLEYLRRSLRAGIKKSTVGASMLGSVWFVAYSANALAFWYGNQLRLASENPSGEAGTIYAVVFLILDASFVVGQIGPFIQTFALAAAAGQTVFSVLDHRPPDIDVYSKEGKTCKASHFQQDIHLRHVSFVYPARPTARVLDETSLRFRSGKVTGVVGPTGSGKSTIIGLLLRLYDPSAGEVTLGPENLKTFSVSTLRTHMALVTQHPVLFTGTILDNIKHGLSTSEQQNLKEEDIEKRCTAAAVEAHCDFIDRLPDGLHTQIGTGLSGGQKQRITLARALVGNPSLLLLDEFTSAMDATSEAIVVENLKRTSASTGRTTIIIAHRLVTVRDADRILVLKDGALVEEGPHDDLLKANGLYSELIKAQKFDKTHELSTKPSLASISQPLGDGETLEASNRQDAHKNTKAQERQEESSMSSGELIKRSLRMNRNEFPAIGLGLFCSIVSGSIIIGEAIVFGNLVELLNNRTDPFKLESRVSWFSLIFFFLSVIALISHTCGGSAFGVVSENLVVRVRDKSFRTILMQDISWFAKPRHSYHSLMSRLNMDSGHLSGLSGVILGTFFSISTSVIGGIILAHLMAWKIAIVLLSAVPIMLMAGFLRLRILAKAEERHQSSYTAAAALASEACAGIQTVAALGRERDVLQMYKAAIQKPYEESLRFAMMGNILLAFSLSVTYFVYALAYWWGAKNVRNGNYNQRDFFTVLPALLFSAQAAGQLFSLAPEITRARTAAQSVFSLHDEKPTILNDYKSSSSSDLVDGQGNGFHPDPQDVNKGQLEFRHVSLQYETRPNVFALNDVSFVVGAGQYAAFVGRSGAGKSSAMHLIERFYDPTKGTVLLDGKDIRNGFVEDHRAKVGFVEQEPDLFPGSVEFNIGLGAKPGVKVSHEEIVAITKKCGLHDFIMSLPEGYSTEVGTHGSKLSGGQRQRLAIARALIRDPEVLLLDEATSQLDATTERQLRTAIAAASSGRTTIMIAHRLASIQQADRIFVFEHGQIVEQGTHDELVASGGIYTGMVAAQELD
ncbi:leptomycin B resistance protein pmd1 [Lophiostoma macrostomum CBS 122681]|uniref:Leptomycin B resistance protein pmd1 n=1 Tax=Lophiostoma macrostomum CBS 122681 TaxID=1314788 RepID=A0A6A6TDE8_9PLEO|nr:leptomycin B resistance protein pmd1 [Lophiostoma macrostomum CBS 122681]